MSQQHKAQLGELQEMQRACMLCRDSEGKVAMKHASKDVTAKIGQCKKTNASAECIMRTTEAVLG